MTKVKADVAVPTAAPATRSGPAPPGPITPARQTPAPRSPSQWTSGAFGMNVKLAWQARSSTSVGCG